jgi:hypothetical protein
MGSAPLLVHRTSLGAKSVNSVMGTRQVEVGVGAAEDA